MPSQLHGTCDPDPKDSLVVFLAALLFVSLSGPLAVRAFGDWAVPAFSLALGSIPVLAVFAFRLNPTRTLRMKGCSFRGLGGGIALAAGMCALVTLGSALIALLFPAIPLGGKDLRTNVFDGNIARLVLSIVVLPALSEELLFRGIILSGLEGRLGKKAAIGLCAVMFGLLHLEPLQIPFSAAVGVALSWTALETGSIAVPIAMHAFHNLALLLLARSSALPGVAASWGTFLRETPVSFQACAALCALAVAVILCRAGVALIRGSSPSRGPKTRFQEP